MNINFFKGHERSIRAKKNILSLIFLKGYSVVVSFALIPLTLKLLDQYQFGVWITLFNVLSWISIFDIGIGNGLRNKFSEALAIGNLKEAKAYVSTAYFLMIGISVLLIILFLIPWYIVDWTKVFNVPKYLGEDLFLLVGIAFYLTSIQFTLKLIGTLLTASHRPSLSALIGTISNTLIFLTLLFLKPLVNGSLFAVGLIYMGVPLLVFIFASLYFFNHQFNEVSPTIKFFEKEKVRSLFSLGSQFFIIQIAVLVIFTTDSLIITHTLSPKEVTPYNVVLRYFGIVTMAVGIFMTPFWSAYTEAASKNEFNWIKSILKKQLKAMFFVFLLVLALLFSAKWLIPLWLQENISISPLLLIGMAGFTLVVVWNNVFSFLLNGLSITRVQTYTSLVGTLVNIPLSVYFAQIWGNGGVILATIISISFFAVFGSRQAYSYLKSK
jgi:O-antigen/teichoic acid export membrane protein